MFRSLALIFCSSLIFLACDSGESQNSADSSDSSAHTKPVRPPHWSDSGRWEGPEVSSDSTIWETEPKTIGPDALHASEKSFFGSWDDDSALVAMYPGKLVKIAPYDESDSISVSVWVCPDCETQSLEGWDQKYPEVFPYAPGVDSRVLHIEKIGPKADPEEVLVFTSSTYYTIDFLLSGRFQCAVLGAARFVPKEGVWTIVAENLACGCYGSFSKAPVPTVNVLGDRESHPAFHVVNGNGGPGGPYSGDLHWFAEENGTYRQVLQMADAMRSNSETTWTFSPVPYIGECRYCDLDIVRRGTFNQIDIENGEKVPQALDTIQEPSFTFYWRQSYRYNGKRYQLTADSIGIQPGN